MTWNKKYRRSPYDPRMAYLTVIPSKGVSLRISDYFADANGVMRSITLFSKWFSIKKHGSLKKAIIAAKKTRNFIAPDVLGERFMEFGPRPRRHMSTNTSGTVGVFHEPEKNRYRAICCLEIRDFCYGPNSAFTESAALAEAIAYRQYMIGKYYRPIEEIRAEVFNDPDVLDIKPTKNKPKKQTNKVKKAA